MFIYNARIYGQESLQGLFIKNEVIEEIGPSHLMQEKYQYLDTLEKIDVLGKRIIPGLIDTHLHLISYAEIKSSLLLDKAKSISEVIKLGKEYLSNNQDIQVIIGNLYNDNNFIEKRPLERLDLDQISNKIPIIVYRVCGHICSVNSKTIEVLNLDINQKIEGGSFDIRDGKLIGIIRENAINTLYPLLHKEYTVLEYRNLIIKAIKDANMVGLTSLHVNDLNSGLNDSLKKYEAYKILAKEGKLNARIYHQITFDEVELVEQFLNKIDYENSYLKMGPLKLFMDGSFGAKTAALFDNYLYDEQNGIICLDKQQLNEFINFTKKNNIQLIVHAIGDRAISLVLDEYEKKYENFNYNRNGIVHVQITSKDILKRFEELKICALVQPIFINTDMFMVYDRVNKDLANTSYAFKTLFEITKTSFGSDAPVEDFNPFLGIYHAVTRRDLSFEHLYLKEEALTRYDAIRAYTTNGAFMSFEENIKGELKEGYLADILVLDQDIYEIEERYLKDIKPEYVIVGGKIVYKK